MPAHASSGSNRTGRVCYVSGIVKAVPLPSGDQLVPSHRVIEKQGDQDGDAGLLFAPGLDIAKLKLNEAGTPSSQFTIQIYVIRFSKQIQPPFTETLTNLDLFSTYLTLWVKFFFGHG